VIEKAHAEGALIMEKCLDQGKNVVFLTLGDVTVYCTFIYLKNILERDGYKVELVNGITSFCASAARLGVSLADWDETLHIIPAFHNIEDITSLEGNLVLMKSASHIKEVKEALRESGRAVKAVENCTMEGEKIYSSLEEIPDDAGYFTLMIAK